MTAARGIAMVEAVLAAAVVGGLAVAALSLVSSIAVERRVTSERGTGQLLVWQLGEEIASLPLLSEKTRKKAANTDVSKVVEKTMKVAEVGQATPVRVNCDEVLDYAGHKQSPPRERDGTAVPGTEGWTREVSITEVSPDDPTGEEVVGTAVFRVHITATVGGRVAGELIMIRADAAEGVLR